MKEKSRSRAFFLSLFIIAVLVMTLVVPTPVLAPKSGNEKTVDKIPTIKCLTITLYGKLMPQYGYIEINCDKNYKVLSIYAQHQAVLGLIGYNTDESSKITYVNVPEGISMECIIAEYGGDVVYADTLETIEILEGLDITKPLCIPSNGELSIQFSCASLIKLDVVALIETQNNAVCSVEVITI
ncbi:MAG: hypothetical protein JSV09_12730 [Thermoplasmata archaeon]|nr:MAG: hypothetical protein JSV09_12730 [Thermoplasmata archaeon]